jgi:hypothetical protein
MRHVATPRRFTRTPCDLIDNGLDGLVYLAYVASSLMVSPSLSRGTSAPRTRSSNSPGASDSSSFGPTNSTTNSGKTSDNCARSASDARPAGVASLCRNHDPKHVHRTSTVEVMLQRDTADGHRGIGGTCSTTRLFGKIERLTSRGASRCQRTTRTGHPPAKALDGPRCALATYE